MAFPSFTQRAANLFLLAVIAAAPLAHAQSGGRVILVLPFENRSGNPSLNWVGDSFPDTLDKRLDSAGFLTISHDDRAFAFDHLGLPADFKPSRATTIRIAQQLDANFVIIGSFATAGDKITIQSQILSVDDLKLSPPVEDSAELLRLYDAENAIAWKVAHTIQPTLNVAEGTFLAASGSVPLPAFEDYIRGTTAPTPEERLKRLQAAVGISPDYAAALLALGKAQYAARDYTAAAAALAKVPPASPLALEAGFYLGLSRFNSNSYAGAQAAFHFVASRLPLPEVLNDEGVSLSRQAKDGVDLFQRASAADPGNEDYHYNLAVALFRRGDTINALKEADAALKLQPQDNDVGQLRARLSLVPPGTRLTALTASTSFTPVERIVRTYSEASFRQAAFQLDQLRDARLAMLTPDKRAAEYVDAGNAYLAQGLLPEAEEQFQSALEANPRNAAAHAGLAQIRQASGATADARAEAQSSLNDVPNVPALLILARLDLAANQLPAAVNDINQALRLDPHNPSVIALQMSITQHPQPSR
jgi:tetratricopeptide (TPR) repeat protein